MKTNKAFKDVLDFILYENPTSQDEIAEKLGLSRRYIARLLKPLIDKNIVKKSYRLDLKKYRDIYHSENDLSSDDDSTTFLIKEMLRNMNEHVLKQLKTAFDALIEENKEKAGFAMKMDYTTNNFFKQIHSSVETLVSIDPSSQFSKALIFNEIAYDLERIGDQCDYFSKFVLNKQNKTNKEFMDILKSMYKHIEKMIVFSMNTFLKGNLSPQRDIKNLQDKIRYIRDLTDKVKSLYEKIINNISIEMVKTSFKDEKEAMHYIYLSGVANSFKRISDICVEIMDTSLEFHENIPRFALPRSRKDYE